MGAEAGLVFFVVVVALAFYWILLRPVIVQQRRQRSDIQNLEVGDEVLTQAGFIARVKDIRVPPEGPTEIVLELGPGVEVRAYATAIVQRLSSKSEPGPEAHPAVAEAPLARAPRKRYGRGSDRVRRPCRPQRSEGSRAQTHISHPVTRFFAAAQNDSGRRAALYARGWLR